MSDGFGGPLPNAAEQALYRTVLEQGGRVMFRDVAEGDVEAALRLIEIGLLVHHTEDSSLTAVNPRSVGERLSAELRSTGVRMLVQAEELPGQLDELAQRYDATPHRLDRTSKIQHVDNFAEIRHRIIQIEADLREEALAAQPGGARPAGHLTQSMERIRRFLERGGTSRTIYEPGAKTDAATVQYAAVSGEWGEQVRVLSEPFTRLLVFDRRVAVIPASADNSSAAFVEDSAVVSFLVGVFERDWERAERVRWGALQAHDDGLPAHEQVGRLLSQGLTQRVVASRLGLSERTVAGHISRLRELYDAETLFQLGWLMRGERDE